MLCAHPLFRLPVFVMGMFGGLQVLRAHNNWENFQDPNLNNNILHILFPWGCCGRKTASETKGKETESSEAEGKETESSETVVKDDKSLNMKQSIKIWSKRVDVSTVLYVLIIASLAVTQAVLEAKYTGIGTKLLLV